MALHVMEEANRCLGCKNPRCREGCPIHTNIPEVIRLLKAGKLNDAGWMLFENNPLTTSAPSSATMKSSARGTASAALRMCRFTSPLLKTTFPPPTPTR